MIILGTMLLSLGGLLLSVGLAAVLLGLLCYLFVLLFKRINIWVAALIGALFGQHKYNEGYKKAMEEMGYEPVKPSKKCKKHKTKYVKVKERIIIEKEPVKEVIIGTEN